MISVVIPVRDGGAELRRCLEAIRRQQVGEEVEVVVIDSGSGDGSPELAEQLGARVHTIPAEKFGHGATRNLGAGLARGDTLVFTTQDAVAASERWLDRLTAPLRGDPALAGVYGRQLPHPHASPPERYFLDFLYGPAPRRQRARQRAELSLRTTLFSNVNAAVRRSVWEDFRFAHDIIMSEDQEWAARVLLAGWELAYEPAAAVSHSHAYTLASAFRRFFDSGVSAEEAYLAGGRSAGGVLARTALDYGFGELRWLWCTGQRRWIPYAAAYELAKLAGLQLGARHRRLPRWIKLRLTGLPGHWRAL